jgi:peptidoglycan/xylan/chitin deacetylase (PgdA/CDA1 family)
MRAHRPATRTAFVLVALGALACSGRGPSSDSEPPQPPTSSPDLSGGTASPRPPGGLAAQQVPLFVSFGFDDNGISGRDGSGTTGGVRFVRELFAGRRNADGSPALFSFYATTAYIAAAEGDRPQHVKHEWRLVADAGHEIALHTHSHPHGRGLDAAAWRAEIEACASWLGKPFAAERLDDPAVGIGVPRAALVGFRAPFLEYDRPLFTALRGAGVLYDCSVEEGFAPEVDGGGLPWPYRIAPTGAPAAGSAGELWELPVYALFVPPDEECERYGAPAGLRDRLHRVHPYFDPAAGKITGFDWNLWVEFGMSRDEVVATFAYTLDQRLAGNRAPLTFGAHSDLYSEQYPAVAGSTAAERRAALADLLDLALARPEVRVTTAREVVDWVRARSSIPAVAGSGGDAGRPPR